VRKHHHRLAGAERRGQVDLVEGALRRPGADRVDVEGLAQRGCAGRGQHGAHQRLRDVGGEVHLHLRVQRGVLVGGVDVVQAGPREGRVEREVRARHPVGAGSDLDRVAHLLAVEADREGHRPVDGGDGDALGIDERVRQARGGLGGDERDVAGNSA
jgi:hypothetical protein